MAKKDLNGADIPIRAGAKYVVLSATSNAITASLYYAGVNSNQARKNAQSPDNKLYNSKIGTSVLSDFTVPAFDYTDPVTGTVYNVPEFKTYECLIYTNANKNIVKTAIQGLPGTVKEYISSSDNNVVIEGIITGSNGVYPAVEVNNLNKLIEAPVAFKVVSTYLQNLNIDTLVIESAEINQEEGGYSYQRFKLYCVTDIPVELNIISDSNTTA